MRVLRTLVRLLWRATRYLLLGLALTFVLCTALSFAVGAVTLRLRLGDMDASLERLVRIFELAEPVHEELSLTFSGTNVGCRLYARPPMPAAPRNAKYRVPGVFGWVYRSDAQSRDFTLIVTAPWLWLAAGLCALAWLHSRARQRRSAARQFGLARSRSITGSKRSWSRCIGPLLLAFVAMFAFCTALSFAVGDVCFELKPRDNGLRIHAFDVLAARLSGFEIEWWIHTYQDARTATARAALGSTEQYTVPGVLSWRSTFHTYVHVRSVQTKAAWIWAILLLCIFVWSCPRIRQRWRLAHGYCVQCGYNLTGNVSGRCPECGAEVQTAKDGHDHVAASSATSSASGSGPTSPD